MTDWELILTMVGETLEITPVISGHQKPKWFLSEATTDIRIAKDSKGFDECKDSAVEGGTIANNTRK